MSADDTASASKPRAVFNWDAVFPFAPSQVIANAVSMLNGENAKLPFFLASLGHSANANLLFALESFASSVSAGRGPGGVPGGGVVLLGAIGVGAAHPE